MLIIASFIAFILSLIVYFLLRNKKYKDIAGIISGIMLLVWCGSMLISTILSFVLPYKYETKIVSVKPIFSVESGNKVNGTFVLGTGSIDQTIVYYYYVQEKEGIKLESADSDNVYIVESNKKPVIETVVEKPVYTYHWIGKIIGLSSAHVPVTYYKLIVPRNTVKKVFDLQLRN
ncbi:hypothetical protein [Thermoanaerobacterium butyriciformans]|jgi:hypothetical protein|uniref:DUF4811 domain-containing protein n=1 Tax=Thermoanaerobacterium butyriciformans TaxID=1702242 RepID=A0ABS4NB31_9THEO|nr:hypothetical protein [Thermoanaerobacterium butyriciformans]MBP2070877.1 hypothetical protein [Thermoanaerobacterium butyriciformans]